MGRQNRRRPRAASRGADTAVALPRGRRRARACRVRAGRRDIARARAVPADGADLRGGRVVRVRERDCRGRAERAGGGWRTLCVRTDRRCDRRGRRDRWLLGHGSVAGLVGAARREDVGLRNGARAGRRHTRRARPVRSCLPIGGRGIREPGHLRKLLVARGDRACRAPHGAAGGRPDRRAARRRARRCGEWRPPRGRGHRHARVPIVR